VGKVFLKTFVNVW